MESSRLPLGSSWWKERRRREMMLEEMTNSCAPIFDADEHIGELVGVACAMKDLLLNRSPHWSGRVYSAKLISWGASQVRMEWGEFGRLWKWT